MEDLIMLLCGVLFMVLFLFLLFVFVVFILSLFKKQDFANFEPNISIIVPAFNEQKGIKDCLDSILNSNYPKEKMEVIVVDDGSFDYTRKIVKGYANVRLLKQNHCGKSEALNLGTSKSKYDFIVTIDADTIIEKNCIRELVRPFINPDVGASTGVSGVRNRYSLIGAFQNVEYHYNNLIRSSFSALFNHGIWFFGALACYRKEALKKTGFFKRDTLAEDVDIALEMKKEGYKIINMRTAVGSTIVPETLKALYRQRARWWMGVLQSLVKNKKLFSKKSSPAINFLFVNHFWWSFYSFVSLPAIAYQLNYWLPYNSTNFFSIFGYVFRWFSLSGPFYVLYKIPEWGISYYSFFGVLSGLISTILIISSLKMFKDRLSLKNLFALFFYFPYTIVLNIMVLISLLTFKFWRNKFFIR